MNGEKSKVRPLLVSLTLNVDVNSNTNNKKLLSNRMCATDELP